MKDKATPAEIILGLGANLGDKRATLAKAITLLTRGDTPILRDITLSSLYESEALMPENAPKSWDISFYNMAVKGKTMLSPDAMLGKIKTIETQLGRRPADRWAPREIDMDILLWDNTVVNAPDLTVPHIGLLLRPFALLPVAELVPDWRYPVPGRDYGARYAALAKPYMHSSTITTLNESLAL